jgi:uncharacterized protein YehS (DUF1456 family)
MINNDILRRLRYAFDIKDDQMLEIFAKGDLQVSRAQISNWLKKEEDENYELLLDVQLSSFLNGFISEKRGIKEGEKPKAEKHLNNNIVFRKLKIALNMKDTDILEIFDLVKLRISKHELSAFFRKPGQNQYRVCKDQFLRNFLHGLQMKHRPTKNKD